MKTRSQRPRGAVAVAIAAAIGLPLSACSSAATSSSSAATSSSGLPKTVVFSSPSLSVTTMKQLANGVEAYAQSKGWKFVAQDPKGDPGSQATQLNTVVASGTVGALYVISITPSSLDGVLHAAQAKGIPVVINGTPSSYGYSGLQPGITFDTIDYAKYGDETGRELGTCINQKLGGKAQVLWGMPPADSAGAQEMDQAMSSGLKAVAPNAKIVSEIIGSTTQAAQTDTGNSLQGHPGLNAVLSSVDEVALGALDAFQAAGKSLPCSTDAGGDNEVQAAVKEGKIYAAVALQFDADIAQCFNAVVAMRSNPKQEGRQLTIPIKVVTAGV